MRYIAFLVLIIFIFQGCKEEDSAPRNVHEGNLKLTTQEEID